MEHQAVDYHRPHLHNRCRSAVAVTRPDSPASSDESAESLLATEVQNQISVPSIVLLPSARIQSYRRGMTNQSHILVPSNSRTSRIPTALESYISI